MKNLLSRGFTMIELMISVAVIGLIAATIMTNLSAARAKARDSGRLESLRQVQTALETYRNERGRFPITGSASDPEWWGTCAGFGEHGLTGATGWVPELAPTYIQILPQDPKPIEPNNCFLYRSNGTDYMVLAYGTVETKTPATNPAPRPAQPAEADFAFYTPGARSW